MRLIFMGTPDFAVPSLSGLVKAGHELAVVVTQPDRPKGRGRKIEPGPVKKAALELGLKVIQPEKVSDNLIMDELLDLSPDAIIVVAFGQKIPSRLLHTPRFGCINLHGSLLPEYRGAAPMQRAIMDGRSVTGVTTMYMDEGWDTGDMILTAEQEIHPDMTIGELHDRLAQIGADLLVETLSQVSEGIAPRIKQDETKATFAPRITDKDQLIDWSCSSVMIHDKVRGMNPWPGAYTLHKGNILKIWRTVLQEGHSDLAPGSLVRLNDDGLPVISTGSGLIALSELQPAGGRRMSGQEYVRGYSIACLG